MESLGAEKVARVMDEYFREAFDIVVKYDGIVDKFIGDACLALFNVPARRVDHVARAVAAAKEIRQAVKRLNLEQQWRAELGVGIAVSTGYALAGRIGSNHPSDYTAVGEVVNIAARLQEHAQPGQILVTEDVYRAVPSDLPIAGHQGYQLRGITTPVTAYMVPP